MTIPTVKLRLGTPRSYQNADWIDKTEDVREASAVSITRGVPNERTVADPATCNFTLENLTGTYTPRNPRGAYVDILGQNVPCRVNIAGTVPDLPTVRHTTTTTTGNAATITVALPTGTADGDILVVIHAFGSASQFTPTIDGVGWQRLAFFEEPEAYTAGGTAPYKNVVIWWKRVTAVTEDATLTMRQAGTYHGRVVAMAVQDVGGFVPMIDWGWTTTGGAGYATDGNIQVPPVRGLQLYAAIKWGNVTIAQQGATYTTVASLAGAASQPSVCVLSGSEGDDEVWTNPDYVGTREFGWDGTGPSADDHFDNDPFDFTAGIALVAAEDTRLRAWGEVSAWPQRWATGGQDATVPVSVGGILRRDAKDASRSAFERTSRGLARSMHPDVVDSFDPATFYISRTGFAVWPLRSDLKAIGYGYPGRLLNGASLTFGSDLSPGGDGATPKVSGVVDAIALPFPSFTGVEDEVRNVGFTFALEPTTTVASHVRLKCNLTTAGSAIGQDLRIDVAVAAATFTVTCTRVRQDTLAEATIATATVNRSLSADYHRVLFEWSWDGSGTPTYRLFVDGRPVASGTYTNAGAGSPGGDILLWSDIAIGQVQAFRRVSWQSLRPQWFDLWPAARGYIGETGAERIHRLCREERIAPEVYGEKAENRNRLGPQPTGTLVAVLTDAAEADGGILTESKQRLGYTYRPRTDLYWSTVVELDYSTGVIQPPLEPVEDDQTILNTVTYSGDGHSASDTETEGARGTGRAGVYAKTDDISTFHRTMLAQRAAWAIYLGTLDEARYRKIKVHLQALEALGFTALADSIRALRVGDRIKLSNLPVWIPPGPAYLTITGMEETLTGLTHEITFNTRPASPYMPGIVGDTAAGAVDVKGQRVDASASTVGTGVDADDTTLSVVTSLTDRMAAPWTVDADDMDANINGGGLYIRVGGEVMQVTAITADSSTIAHDAATESATFTTTTPHAFNHTPTGTPAAALVFISHGTPSTDVITSVTYGGVAMTRIGTAADTAGEPGRVYIYALTTGVLTGVQSVSIVHTGSATVKHVVAVTVTASGTLAVREVKYLFEDQANPQATFKSIGATALHYSMLYSGQDAMASVAPLANMTAIHDHDFGAFVTSIDRETASSSADSTIGYTVAAEDVAFLAVELVNTTATQAFTVVRDIDGYSAAHSAGVSVEVAYPFRVSL